MGLLVKEITKRGGGSSSRSTTGRKAKRKFRATYDATTPPASLAAVETANDGTTAIPALYAELPADPSRVVTDISVDPEGNTGLVFIVEVTYTTLDPSEFNNDNPLTDPVDYDWDFSASSQPYFIDETPTTPLLGTNSAGEPYENFLEREVGEISVTVADNIVPSAWDPSVAAVYMADPSTALNNASMTIDGKSISAGQARMGGIKCSGIKERNGVDYRTRTIVLKLRANWDQVVEDRGYHFKLASGKLSEIVKGKPPVKPDKPWPLDGAGNAMFAATSTPATRTHKPYPRKDFGIWGIT
jgi:hypothetical protein